MDDLTGQTLDRYEIVELIGEGGMATVYRARQPRLERDVAIKVMLPELADDPAFRERFEREAKAIANLRHPNILTVYDYGETDDGQLYLVVDYVRGGTLRQRLELPPSVPPTGGDDQRPGGAMPLEEAVEIVAQVAEALDYAHQQGVIHRDVKPNNILLTRDGRPLLADFGLVKPVQSDRRLTASGVMLGTPDYVAPEQAQALEIDGRADIYALGVMLFEVLTGQHPYEGETPLSIIIKHVSEPMPHPSELNPSISPALDGIVAKATAKAPEERYQRAGEMARALRAALVATGRDATPELGVERATPPSQTLEPVSPVVTPVPTPTSVPRPWHQQMRVWAALAVLAVALVVAAALILPSAPSQDGEEELAMALPTAQPGEVMILIAQFKARAGGESYDVSQRIYDKLSDELHKFRETEVTVYQVSDVIESSEAAVAMGRQYGATMVIWGYYDDIGISPNIEAVGALEDSPSSVGLERLNLDTDAANFKRYIAKDLPEELSFLTAISLVQTFMLQGNLDRTMTYIAMAADSLPADPQFRTSGEMIYFIQGMMAFFQGDLEEAVEQIDQAITMNPDRALFHTMRGFAHLQLGEFELAAADLDRAIALEPTDVLAYELRGAVAGMMGDMETVASVFQQLTELTPDDWVGHYLLGMIRFEMGDLNSALVSFDRVEGIMPENPLLPLSRGLVYEKMGRGERAAADYARALELGVLPEHGIQMLSRAVGEHTPVPYGFLFECTTYHAQGEIEQALASCDKALEVDPTCFDALWKRGQLYAAQGEWENAVADYSAAIEADPAWPWVYYLRAQALVELGRSDEAQADLAQALELDPVDELRQQIEALREGGS